MKILKNRALLLIAVPVLFFSCQTNHNWTNAEEYERFYNSINKEYDNAVAFTQNSINQQNARDLKKNKKKNIAAKKDSFYLYVGQISADTKYIRDYIDNIGKHDKKDDNKPRESNLLNSLDSKNNTGSEIAKNKQDNNQGLDNSIIKNSLDIEDTNRSTSQPIVPQNSPVDNPVIISFTNSSKEIGDIKTTNIIRKGNLKVVDQGDSNLLKEYSIIIATMRKLSGAESIKKTVSESDPSVVIFVAQNEKGLYHVIRGSYEKSGDAIAMRNETATHFTKRYNKSGLMKKFGVPFNDLWILHNEN